MSDIRHTHPGYFGVTLGLAVPWYMGLGIAFLLSHGTLSASSKAYGLIAAYIPLRAWGVIYLVLGIALLTAILIPKIPHTFVRVCTGFGLMLTTFWLGLYLVALATGRMDLVSVIPAWFTVALVEWQALIEPQNGPMRVGPRGHTGVDGPRGATGAAGATGATGAAGADGAKGLVGTEGKEGLEGKDSGKASG